MRRAFNGLRGRKSVHKSLAMNLGQLEKFMRSKMYSDSFHSIRTFGLTKNTYTNKRKVHALKRMLDLCRNQYTTDT